MRPSEAGRVSRERIDVPWDDLRAARVQRTVLAGIRLGTVGARPRPRVWVAGAAAAVLAVLAVLLVYARPWPLWPLRVDFADGSTVVPDRGARVIPAVVSPDRIEVEQVSGVASYEVAPRPDRVFVVRAGVVRVEVIGTSFRVERSGGTVRVRVARGRVLVSRGDRTMVLGANEEISLAEDDPRGEVTSTGPASGPAPVTSGEASAPAAPAVPASAPTTDDTHPPDMAQPAEGPTAAELFRLADDARARGDTAAAVRLLRELVRRYPRDGRVTMGLFTIGRLERARGSPAEAARAFEACSGAQGAGALGGEALAEAALARAAAGDPSRARTLAARYLAALPGGPRAGEMSRLAR
jgi:TolA-binding protein